MERQESQNIESIKAATQKLIAKQTELIHMLNLTEETLQEFQTPARTFLEDQLDESKSLWNQITANHAKICEDACISTSAYYQENRIAAAKRTYNVIKAAIYQQLEARNPPTSSTPQSVTSTTSSQLPRMNLPTFSGSYMEWISFRNLFMSVVHQNPSLTDVQRLHYLRTCLKGEALACIAGVPLTDEEYAGAWASLRDRYENKRVLINNHIDYLVSIPAIKRDTAAELRSLCDSTTQVLRSLDTLGRKDHLGNDICVHLTVQRLSPSLRKDWERHLGDDTSPPISDLLKFLESSTRALESAASSAPKSTPAQGPSAPRARPQGTRALHATAGHSRPCPCCQGSHYLGRCTEFREKTPEQRRQLAVQHKVCMNCLSSSHSTKQCKSEYRCTKCQRAHHTLLHPDTASPAAREAGSPNELGPVQHPTNAYHASQPQWQIPSLFLPTAMVVLRSPTGRCCRIRALLDQGSEACFISERAAQMLRPHLRSRIDSNCSLEVLRSHRDELQLQSRPKALPQGWIWLSELSSTDHFLLPEVRQGPPGSPTAQNTALGWILSGAVHTKARPSARTFCSHATTLGTFQDAETHELLRRFWEIEELPTTRILTSDEQTCEDHFAATHQRNTDGRYTVRLPFKQTPMPDLRVSRIIAVHRLEHLERRLSRDYTLRTEYSSFLQEYEALGHMSPTKVTTSAQNTYYMPHHAVIRETSSTTKLRVVFNASGKNPNAAAVVRATRLGPALQNDLISIILKWRIHRYVFSADIEKMYRQIRVHDDDAEYQRIVWRDEPSASPRDFKLTTVTYGTAAAPYLALRTLQQLASDEESKFPLGAAALREDFYVDDLLSGAGDLNSALARQREISQLLEAGGFRLRKWISNDPALLQAIRQEDRLQPASRVLQLDEHVRTLGIHWNAATDTFHFQVSPSNVQQPTKRKVLAAIARLFDPLGWLAPVVAKAKILMQRLWSAQLDWDQALPNDLANEWGIYQEELPQLSCIAIPRWTKQTATTSSIELHGFCDASIHAYAAAIYVRVSDQTGAHVILLTAKTKVAPLKQISTPRLELCGAVLLTRMLDVVYTTMRYQKVPIHAWTDSKIVLAWLQGHPTRWTCFVANRVSEIQSTKLKIHWHHVPSKDNPADCASRGMNPSELPHLGLWWHGPTWLRQPPSKWPKERTSDHRVCAQSAVHLLRGRSQGTALPPSAAETQPDSTPQSVRRSEPTTT
ncbi:hypothetical protein KPH14_008479 [Odynerus spinipes]|uniref:Peptidase aspartic putative domain-containing protein n=1 Tax=Odynerus spinipes TaxID=1348599 RepID=A0AAD9R945_9HYME|nr:hypothetical protein KPH14_008479 [Odynerus spinipes]